MHKNVKPYLLLIALAIIMLVLSAFAIKLYLESVVGKWQSPEDSKFQLEIYKSTNGKYYGKVLSGDNKGKVVLNDLIYNTSKNELEGTITPPDANFSAVVTINFVNSNKLKLTLHKLFMTKTLYLIRI